MSLNHFGSLSVIIRKLFFHLFDFPNSRLVNRFSHQTSVRRPVCTCIYVCTHTHLHTHTHIHTHPSYTSMNISNILKYSHFFLYFLQLLAVNSVILNSVLLIFIVKISPLSIPFSSLSTFFHNSIYYFTSSSMKRMIKYKTLPTY